MRALALVMCAMEAGCGRLSFARERRDASGGLDAPASADGDPLDAGTTDARTPDSGIPAGWWDTGWRFRVPLLFRAFDRPVEVRLYADGSSVSAWNPRRGWTLAPGEALVGGHIDPSLPERWDGAIEKVRISPVARSEAWIRLEHASMLDPLLRAGTPEAL